MPEKPRVLTALGPRETAVFLGLAPDRLLHIGNAAWSRLHRRLWHPPYPGMANIVFSKTLDQRPA